MLLSVGKEGGAGVKVGCRVACRCVPTVSRIKLLNWTNSYEVCQMKGRSVEKGIT